MKPQIIFVTCLFLMTEGHVRLDFPRARDLDLDFLDNVRTPAPCGMPKGEAMTSIEAGRRFNVTWHLAYPHQGKNKLYRIFRALSILYLLYIDLLSSVIE